MTEPTDFKSTAPFHQRCEAFVLESVNPVNRVGPASQDTWWAGAAYQPLVPPCDSGTNEYTWKNTSQRCRSAVIFAAVL